MPTQNARKRSRGSNGDSSSNNNSFVSARSHLSGPGSSGHRNAHTRNNANSGRSRTPFYWVADPDKRAALAELKAKCRFGVKGTDPEENRDPVSYLSFDDPALTAHDVRTKIIMLSSGWCYHLDTLKSLYTSGQMMCPMTRTPFTPAEIDMIRAVLPRSHRNNPELRDRPFWWVQDSTKRQHLIALMDHCSGNIKGHEEHADVDAATGVAYDTMSLTELNPNAYTTLRDRDFTYRRYCANTRELVNRYHNGNWTIHLSTEQGRAVAPWTTDDIKDLEKAMVERNIPLPAYWNGYDPQYARTGGMDPSRNRLYWAMGVLGRRHEAFRVQDMHLLSVDGTHAGAPTGWPRAPQTATSGAAVAVTKNPGVWTISVRAKYRTKSQQVKIVDVAAVRGSRYRQLAKMMKEIADRTQSVNELYTLVRVLRQGAPQRLSEWSPESPAAKKYIWFVQQIHRFIVERVAKIDDMP